MAARGEASRVKLFYFDIRGKGAPIRWLAAQTGIEFEDVRVKREEFHAMRDKGLTPFGQLPVAEFYDKDNNLLCRIAQMRAILRYMARSSGNKGYSSDLAQAAVIDSFLDFEEDVFNAMRSSIFPARIGLPEYASDEAKEAMRRKVAEEVLTPKLAYLIQALENSKSGWIAGGDLSIADLALGSSLMWLNGGVVDGVPAGYLDGKSPLLKEYIARFAAEFS
ncbi:glutathione S-transferase [Chloropicon primus]|uniref:Glutathione S-transferase n=1 Tax=Chloropicon primus TaxID=1764295 RepID=A0A5B8MSP5_9CHLO|nr:glutathione S-transferase [Chloropicon primus]UPR01609.1 glutathione S-transferase [Chloropicon primus]|eukprot:QDZ22392.1 glutathione S-transferase [Chloropicon primus]